MHFTYCPDCGALLNKREIGDEGLIPWCDHCRKPLFDLFATCVICAVVNEDREVALLRQNYLSKDTYVCVSGYMKPGERAEDTACREIREEIGQEVNKLTFIATYPLEKRDQLMIGFKAEVEKKKLILSGEVDSAGWFPLEEALSKIRPGSIAWQLVKSAIGET